MKAQEYEKMEIEAKTFACSLLSDSSILSKKREKQIREYLKKNNFLKSDSESSVHQKIKQFKTAVCFNNMYINKANDILISLSDGKYDFLEDKSNSKFFDFEPNDDFKELTKNMKQTNKIMEHLQKEEESLHEKRKDDPELDKNMKDFEKKMFKNPKFTDINGNPVDLNNLDFTTDREERLKKEIAKNKKEEINKLKEFVESTGSNGVIKIYGNLCSTNEFGTNYFYELMELAEKDWEKDILSREKKKLYYQEYELMDIFTHLIKTFSALQTINFTHRDINPQNIMMVNGSFKICDFGNSKLLKKGGNIIQKIRGSEIFMSPIVFKGYHSGVQTIKHNTFKSDVFSLGMCFFLAASLSYDALNAIREIYDMKIINKILKKFLVQLMNYYYLAFH